MSIKSYKNKSREDIARGINSRSARQILPLQLHNHARRRLQGLQAAKSLDDIKSIRGNRYHQLERGRKGQHAIAINQQFRICFMWIEDSAFDVEIVDYH